MTYTFPAASIAAFGLTTGSPIAREIVLRYLAEWRHAKPLLNGNDILEMGIPPGPQVKQALQLCDPDLKAVNSKASPDRITPKSLAKVKVDGERVEAVLAPASWNVIQFGVA